MHQHATGSLHAVQTGRLRPLQVAGRKLMSGIGKTAVFGPVEVGVLGLVGDEQADLSVHGGLSKAVYALPFEHLSWWQSRRQVHAVTLFEETLPPGFLGENLSLMGVLENDLYVGDCLDFGQVLLRVTQPREPCGKFNAIMGYAQAAKDMVLSGRCGFYLAVDRPGLLQAGDPFEVIPGPRSIGIVQALQRQAWRYGR